MKFSKAAPLDPYHFDDGISGFIDRIFVKPRYERHGFYRSMFDDDFSRIFCLLPRDKGERFSVLSNDDELTKRLLGNVESGYRSHGLDEIVYKLVVEIAQSLTMSGTTFYFFHDVPKHEELHLAYLSANSIYRFLTVYFQLVPKRRLRHRTNDDEEIPREIRILDRDKLMCFNMPSSIKRILTKQNRTLAVLDKQQKDRPVLFPQATHENPTPKNHFDFDIWIDTQDLALNRASHDTGWHCRNFDGSKRSDFFVCHRKIRFRRNQLILRDHILFQLGNELTRVGRQYREGFHIAITPSSVLPKVEELNELEILLSLEKISFTEVMDFCDER
jgi:hypothetical protein|tara:strand:+ start:16 stop:1008 length:993 start_codon:yes stop_codon:yes gene_type:complete